MISLGELKRHFYNITVFRAYSIFEPLKQLLLFPIDYYLRNGKSGYPLNVSFFVTSRCNARCQICKVKKTLAEKGGEGEPTLDDIEKFLSGLEGTKPSIVLFGGEPFIRNDIPEIVALIKKRGLHCGIFTNGILLNKEIIDNLKGLNLDFIVFSIQGPKNIHDKIMGIEGAYDKLMENMDFFIKPGSQTKVIAHITLTEELIKNIKEIGELVFLLKNKGVNLIRFGHLTFLTPRDVEKNQEVGKKLFFGEEFSELGYVYSPEEISEKYHDAVKKIKERLPAGIRFNPELNLSEIKNWYSDNFKTRRKCYFLWRALFIYPNGDVFPCESLKYPLGNIYKENLKNIWNNKKYIKLRRILKKGLLPACARCCRL